MKNQLLVTVIGQDRPGIVARLTEIIAHEGGNLEASRMAILGGEFAAISLITAPSDKLAKLEIALKALSQEELTVISKPTKCNKEERFQGYTFYKIMLSGADHEGIVHSLSAYLQSKGINFQEVETNLTNAPETGSPLFTMQAEIAVPPSVTFNTLNNDLTALAQEEAVEIDLLSSSTLHSIFVVS